MPAQKPSRALRHRFSRNRFVILIGQLEFGATWIDHQPPGFILHEKWSKERFRCSIHSASVLRVPPVPSYGPVIVTIHARQGRQQSVGPVCLSEDLDLSHRCRRNLRYGSVFDPAVALQKLEASYEKPQPGDYARCAKKTCNAGDDLRPKENAF